MLASMIYGTIAFSICIGFLYVFVRSFVESEMRISPVTKIWRKKSLLVFGMMTTIVFMMGASFYFVHSWIGGDWGFIAGVAIGGLIFYQGEGLVRKRILGEKDYLSPSHNIHGVCAKVMMGLLDVAVVSFIMTTLWLFGFEPWSSMAWIMIFVSADVFGFACIKEVLIIAAEIGAKKTAIVAEGAL